jgi:uncharacterized protein YdhG (YjbR/CyaY superfamily)
MAMKPKTIDEYIARFDGPRQQKLQEIRAILKSVAPNAVEAIKWGYPVLEEERILFSFSGFKDHINFMPTRATLAVFAEELKDYKTGKDTIQFPYDKPLPKELIKKIAKHRAKEVRENGALWMWH